MTNCCSTQMVPAMRDRYVGFLVEQSSRIRAHQCLWYPRVGVEDAHKQSEPRRRPAAKPRAPTQGSATSYPKHLLSLSKFTVCVAFHCVRDPTMAEIPVLGLWTPEPTAVPLPVMVATWPQTTHGVSQTLTQNMVLITNTSFLPLISPITHDITVSRKTQKHIRARKSLASVMHIQDILTAPSIHHRWHSVSMHHVIFRMTLPLSRSVEPYPHPRHRPSSLNWFTCLVTQPPGR
jgi:hypothetical protein